MELTPGDIFIPDYPYQFYMIVSGHNQGYYMIFMGDRCYGSYGNFADFNMYTTGNIIDLNAYFIFVR